MTEAELIELIIKKRNELDDIRTLKVSRSLIRLQEDELRELESIYAAGEAARQELRPFLDQCAEKYDKAEIIGAILSSTAKKTK